MYFDNLVVAELISNFRIAILVHPSIAINNDGIGPLQV